MKNRSQSIVQRNSRAGRPFRNECCFVMSDEYKEFEQEFLKFATERGMVGIKGHRSIAVSGHPFIMQCQRRSTGFD